MEHHQLKAIRISRGCWPRLQQRSRQSCLTGMKMSQCKTWRRLATNVHSAPTLATKAGRLELNLPMGVRLGRVSKRDQKSAVLLGARLSQKVKLAKVSQAATIGSAPASRSE